MKVLKEIKCLCPSCMEEHIVSVIEEKETNIFKDKEIEFSAQYNYCSNSMEYFEDETQIVQNDVSMKDAYRRKTGLLTSGDIISIRQKYGISQFDLATILGWGGKTITRYEGHQVQDAAHDSILRKIDCDSEWYLELLDSCREKLNFSAYLKYRETAINLFENQKDEYLRKSIYGAYARYNQTDENNGFTELDLNKVVDVIRYYSNSIKVKVLYKVKLMKMLWYADTLSYKNSGKAITGLVYRALPMGAVPIAYDLIIDLNGISYEEVEFDEGTGYLFINDGNNEYPYLNSDEIKVLDQVIKHFGKMGKNEIVAYMHKEKAYIETQPKNIISYTYAKELSIG